MRVQSWANSRLAQMLPPHLHQLVKFKVVLRSYCIEASGGRK